MLETGRKNHRIKYSSIKNCLFLCVKTTMSETAQSLDGQNLFHTGHLFDLSHLNNVSPGLTACVVLYNIT